MDQAKLQYYQLEKQNLLKKEKQTNYHKILTNHIGLHSTDYLTPYIALWSRVEDFNPKKLFDDINKKEAIRLRAMRRTVFVSHKNNLPILIPAISSSLESHRLENIKSIYSFPLGTIFLVIVNACEHLKNLAVFFLGFANHLIW